ncbi:DUF302 domain-containing protein [Nocardia blacklockiae]|uniref:DUF302 domain-containing protein n=1 Tax=Nocardia blacklockiae TaxID=480036 RepID=UPI00189606CA|nr:DUF302 domain-containing protein [Nocardia blacklockiae]MBF6176631.1 DUF302 domain-containing protein [Nocardia blacklockiae]
MKQDPTLKATLHTSFGDALERTRTALSRQGFGILTEIDVQATMKAKLDVDMAAYSILGACNPPLAHRALDAEPRIGLLLPCNVVVRSTGPDAVLVEAAAPEMMADLVDTAVVTQVAAEATDRLRAAIGSLTDPDT